MVERAQEGLGVITRRSVLAGGVALLALRTRPAAARQTPQAGWHFTDDRGTTVELAEQPSRIAAEINAASALWDYGVRPVAVFGPQHRADGSVDPRVGQVDLAQVESVGEIWGEIDIEKLLKLEADLVVAPTWDPPILFYLDTEGEEALGGAVPTLAIQTAKLSLATSIDRFAELAEALGADLASAGNVKAKQEYDAALEELRQAIADSPDATVMFVAGADDAFYVAHPDFMADMFLLRELGLDIVAPENAPDYWEELSWEEVLKYPADLILVDTREGSYSLEDFAKAPTWAAVPAAKAGQVAEWHAEPIYSYAGYAPELRRLAQLLRDSRGDVV